MYGLQFPPSLTPAKSRGTSKSFARTLLCFTSFLFSLSTITVSPVFFVNLFLYLISFSASRGVFFPFLGRILCVLLTLFSPLCWIFWSRRSVGRLWFFAPSPPPLEESGLYQSGLLVAGRPPLFHDGFPFSSYNQCHPTGFSLRVFCSGISPPLTCFPIFVTRVPAKPSESFFPFYSLSEPRTFFTAWWQVLSSGAGR